MKRLLLAASVVFCLAFFALVTPADAGRWYRGGGYWSSGYRGYVGYRPYYGWGGWGYPAYRSGLTISVGSPGFYAGYANPYYAGYPGWGYGTYGYSGWRYGYQYSPYLYSGGFAPLSYSTYLDSPTRYGYGYTYGTGYDSPAYWGVSRPLVSTYNVYGTPAIYRTSYYGGISSFPVVNTGYSAYTVTGYSWRPSSYYSYSAPYATYGLYGYGCCGW